MSNIELAKEEEEIIEDLVSYYEINKKPLEQFLKILTVAIADNERLKELIHSVKYRTKSNTSLQDKLRRKFIKLREIGGENDFTKENLFLKINDLIGFRLIHLHTSQFDEINKVLNDIFEEEKYLLIEGPEARVWDDELRNYYQSIGIKTVNSDRMYTSVHYVINPNKRTQFTVEIQVRTLAEEIWGEVDHKINYPHQSEIFSCKEQIKVLARVTSSCTRLVDSIFATFKNG